MTGDQNNGHTDPRLARLIEDCVPSVKAQPDWSDVKRRAEVRSTGRRSINRHPGVLWLAAAAALVAVVTLTAVLRNTSPDPLDSSAPKIAPARVDWGMTADVRVTPDPGVPMDRALTSVARALQTRAALRDIAGFEVTEVAPDTLRIRVPAAEEENQLRELTLFNRVEVIDPETSVLATDDSLEKLREAAAGHPAPNGEVRYWLASDSNRIFAPASFTTEAEARKARTFHTGTEPVNPVALPSTLTAASLSRPGAEPTYALVNDQRLVTGSEIRSLRADGDRVVITVTPDALTRLRSARSLALADTEGAGYLSIQDGSVHIEGDALLVQARNVNGALGMIHQTAQPGIDATLTMGSTAQYGARPTPVGEPYHLADPPPGAPSSFSPFDEIRRASMTKMRVRLDDPTFSPTMLAVGTLPNKPPAVILMAEKTGAIMMMSSDCERGLGAPVIQVCSLSRPQGREPGALYLTYVGQTAPDVNSVAVRFPSGATAEGPARDGWFILGTIVRGDDRIKDPVFTARTANGDVAFEGMPQSVRPPFSGASLAFFHEMEKLADTQRPAIEEPSRTMTYDPTQKRP